MLRNTRPNVKRPFKTPFYPVVPILGILVCGAMVYPLLIELWFRVVAWLVIGLIIFALYGSSHAKEPMWKLEDDPALKK